ncbi:DUF4159 domain-containing protein [Microvirga guangxiensis]|uniref:N-terminal double-transmembrane domain-containing protein n=1 Tax=Microvirga guangxiensis TaxID=549386 RepID=A0A1G5CC26_9HYPH|nr:DUF4159 domain-containing protein [Microvirga guangxiensis]SCX99868.1 N-terminal double-transmembrane domain-containing protein [Microvirga guangxiensis]
MLGLPLTFAVPLVLTALAALPAIWLLLRITPPQPKRVDFPPLKILADLRPEQETPARTPWWLLLMRLLLAAFLILAASGPIWNPLAEDNSRTPLLLVVDNGLAAAHDWRDRLNLASERIEAAGRDGRTVAVLGTAEASAALELTSPAAALERLRSLKPQPHLQDRGAHLESIRRLLDSTPDTHIVWISDGVVGVDGQGFIDGLAQMTDDQRVTVLKSERASTLALAGIENAGGRLNVRVVRAEPNGRDSGTLRAVDLKNLPLADMRFSFDGNATETSVAFDLPTEIRNSIARIEILGESSAGAVNLIDERGKRRRVGLVFGGTADQTQPLLSPLYYIERALSPYSEIRMGRGGVADAVNQLIEEQVSILVLADVGGLDRETLGKVTAFVEQGGLLLRFAGSRLAAGNDELVPVRLRRGGRSLGGSLSWDTPKTFAPFTRESPFFGLDVPEEIGIRRQILAEPDGDLPSRTWASLVDGTPIVTADKRGDGLVVLFHVTADATWSNLPLSGLFVDMLRRITALAGTTSDVNAEARAAEIETIAPRLTLDGYGVFTTPPANARAIPRSYAERATGEHPPGFYGPVDSSLALNALLPGDKLVPLDVAPLNARIAPLAGAQTIDLRMPLFMLALILLLADTLASLWLGGHLSNLTGRLRKAGAAAAILLASMMLFTSGFDAKAQELGSRRIDENANPALVTRLAYVITGDAGVDEASRAGLAGLTQILSQRTALTPGDPIGIDPSRDEVAFYPLIYWPIVATRPIPPESAIRKLDAFMKGGGTVIFDTRDAFNNRPDGAVSAEGQYLRRMLATLDIPELEPVPNDHVLTKTFYILDAFPGRYATGQTWVQALPPQTEGEENRPARSGDSVSPIIITSNDLAAAWAVGPRGEYLFPVVGSDPRQRELAYRSGINIVMYSLTGNYKADQVHVPALLERLGQ